MPKFIDTWISELENYSPNVSSSNSDVKKEKIQVGIASAMVKAKQKDYPIVSISSDLAGSTGVASFQKEYPEASIDIGIAESNMVSMACGMSLAGYIPVVDTFAQFGTTKGALPFIMSALSKAPMIAVFSHIGFQDAADGASHQSLTYLSMLNAIPNLETYCLSSSSEAESLMSSAFDQFVEDRKNGKTPKSYVFFLGRENFPQYYKEGVQYQLGKSQTLLKASGSDKRVCIVAVGSLVPQALAAAEQLKEKDYSISVISPGITNAVCDELAEQIKDCDAAFVVEEHQEMGGFHSVLSQKMVKEHFNTPIKSLSVKAKFGQSAYTALELYKQHGLDADSIAQKIEEFYQ